MSYRPWLEKSALRQMAGLPGEAFDTLARLLSRICEEPYDRLLSVAVTDDGRERMAELGDAGFITFAVDEDARLIRGLRPGLGWLNPGSATVALPESR